MSALWKVVKREQCSYLELAEFLIDPRSRLLAFTVSKLEGKIRSTSELIDPSVEGNSKGLTLFSVAGINKQWLVKIHDPLSTALSSIVILLQEITSTLFNSNPVIEEATDLSESLGQIYRAVIGHVDAMNSALSSLESTVFPDEIIQHAAEMRKAWLDLKLLLANHIIAPSKHALQEEARANALRKIGEKLHVNA